MDELVALYWTVSGPVEVHAGREWSLFSFRERCEHAQRVGFSGLGIWHADLVHILESHSYADIRALLDDHGLRHLELECLLDWFVDPGDPRRAASDANRDLLFEAAAELGAHHVKVNNIPGTPCELEALTERFAELCADAAQRHDSPIFFEVILPDVNVTTIDAALAVVGGAGAPNGKLALDTWHIPKLGIPLEDVRRVPGELLGWVELSDGQLEDMDDPVDETINHRALPGEGEFDMTGYVRAFREIGYGGPWGVEVLSEDLRSRPIGEIFDRAYETTAAVLGAAAA
jgi:sugar phosphate isomerase/epimerase